MKNYDGNQITITDKELEECKLDNLPEIVNEFNEEKGVNKPVLASGMKPIIYNETTGEWDEVSEDDSNWYDYDAKKWANVRTNDGSMWVWIPRYAYKITSGYHSNETGEIDIKFLKGKTNEVIDETPIETSGYEVGVKDTSVHYFLHPAFQFNGEELGLWVAKFEVSVANQNDLCYTDASEINCNKTDLVVKIIPNATSWRCINMKNAFNASLNMKNKTDVYGWDANQVDTHMMKNTEWGAVAYLSSSQYGKEGEIWNNSNSTSKTGCAGSGVDAVNEDICNEYDSELGVNASTTGNIYGIYDISGGAWERVMGNYNNLGGNSGFSDSEVVAIDGKYIDRYTTLTEDMLNGVGMDYDSSIYGDAVYETSNGARRNGSSWIGNQKGSWYAGYSNLPYSSCPWFPRGGILNFTSGAGAFAFYDGGGTVNCNVSFRPVVVIN